MPNVDRRVTLGIFGNISDIRAKLGWVKSEKTSLEREGIDVPVDADTKKATISLDDLRAKLRDMSTKVATAKAGVNDKDAIAKLDALNLKLTRLNHLDTRTRISVTGAAKALAEISAVDAALDHLNEKRAKASLGGAGIISRAGSALGSIGSDITPALGNPYVAGGVASALALSAPFAGQAVGGSLIAGLGAGLTGLGIAGAVGIGKGSKQTDVAAAQQALKAAQAREKAAQVANTKTGSAASAATLAGAQTSVTTAQAKLADVKGDALTPGQQKVRESFSRMATDIKKDLASIGVAFQPVLRVIASTADSTFKRLTPVLAGAMRTLAGPLRAFTTQLIQGFSSPAMVGMINSIARAFGAILKALAPALPGLMNQLANAITAIANNVAKNPQAFVGFINFLFHVGIYALNAINALTVAATWLENDFIPILRKVFNPGSSYFAGLQNGVRGAANAIRGSMSNAVNYIRSAWSSARGSTVGAWNSIRSFIMNVAHAIAGFLGSTWRGIQGTASAAWHAIAQSVISRFTAIIAPFRVWGLIVLGIWGNAWRGIRNLTAAIWPSIRNFLLSTLNGIRSNFNVALGAIRGTVNGIWRAISNFTRSIWNALRVFFVSIWNQLRSAFAGPLNAIRNNVRSSWNQISNVSRSVFNALRNFFSNVWTIIRNTFANRINSIRSVVSSGWNWIRNTTVSVFNRVSSFFGGFWRGIRNGFNTLVGDLRGIWNRIKNIFSAPVTWVASHIYNPFANFINKGLGVFGIKSRLPIMKFASGGKVPGFDASGRDDVIARLSRGEFVVNAKSASKHRSLLEQINNRYAKGGSVGNTPAGGQNVHLGTTANPTGGNSVTHALSGAAGAVSHAVSGIWNDLTSAIKLVTGFVGDFAHVPGSGAIRQLAINAPKELISGAISWLTSQNAAGGSASGLAALAQKYGGHRYVWGGGANARTGFDCSSFVNMLSGMLGLPMPGGFHAPSSAHGPATTSWLGFRTMKRVPASQMAANDLYVNNTHMGVVTGPGRGFAARSTATGTGPQSVSGSLYNILRFPGGAAGGISFKAGSGVSRWAQTILEALRLNGMSASYLGQVEKQMTTESGGNQFAHNPSGASGLLQTMPGTFRAYHVKGTSWNIYDGLANIAAAIDYARHEYGPTMMRGGMGLGSGRAYGNGTRSASRGWHLVGDKGPEWMAFNGGESVAPAGANVTYVVNVNIAGHALASKQEIGREVSSALATFKGKGGRV